MGSIRSEGLRTQRQQHLVGLGVRLVGTDHGGIDNTRHRSAAEYLVELGVRLVGTDHGGIDNTRNRDRPGHMVLLQHDILIAESLTNLDRLLGQEVLFVCLPLALQGASGSPGYRAGARVAPRHRLGPYCRHHGHHRECARWRLRPPAG